MLGRQADGWLWGGSRADAGPLRLYSSKGTPLATGPDSATGCKDLDFQRWPCDTDYAFLPIERSADVAGLARTKLRGGAEIWVRPEELGQVVELMSVGADERSGRLLPDDAPIHRAPSVKSASVTKRVVSAAQQFIRAHRSAGSSEALHLSVGEAVGFVRVVTAEAAVKNDEGYWVKVSERLVYTPDDGLTQEAGPVLRRGYLLHRDRRGVVKAVIEPLWCD